MGKAIKNSWWRWKESTRSKVDNRNLGWTTPTTIVLLLSPLTQFWWQTQEFCWLQPRTWTSKLSILHFTSLNYTADRIYYSSMYVSCKHTLWMNLSIFITWLIWQEPQNCYRPQREDSHSSAQLNEHYSMLDAGDRNLTPVRSSSTNSRGQPRQREYQTQQVMIHCSYIITKFCKNICFKSIYCPVHWRGMVLLTCAEQEKQIWESFSTILTVYCVWVLLLALVSNSSAGVFNALITTVENTAYSRRIQKPVFFSSFKKEINKCFWW